MSMPSSLDHRIQAAAEKAAANLENWAVRYIPIKIDEKVYWLTTAVPAEIQEIIGVLPKEREQTDVKRPHQFKTRLSDVEKDAFEILVTASGLPQGEYIRGMILHGRIEVTQTSLVDSQVLESLTFLSATLGKIAGMIRQTVIINKEFVSLDMESKSQLEAQLRSLRHLQTYIQRLAEDIHGHLQA